MPSRVCSTLDCQRVHYAKGYCERCYRSQRRRDARKRAAALAAGLAVQPVSYISDAPSPANTPNKEVKTSVTNPAPAAVRGGVAAQSSTSDRNSSSGEEPSRNTLGDVRPALRRQTGEIHALEGRAALPQTTRRPA